MGEGEGGRVVLAASASAAAVAMLWRASAGKQSSVASAILDQHNHAMYHLVNIQSYESTEVDSS